MPFPKRPTFPDHRALTNLSRDDAARALSALCTLVKAELADVYSAAGSNDTRWNVWLNITWRRAPLQEWAAEWDATWDSTPPDGPDGPEAA